MAQDDDISNAINIARRDATADAIQSKISGLNQNLAGLDLEANVPQFNTGLNQPQIGGAGMSQSIGWSPKRTDFEISSSHYNDGRSKAYVATVNPMDFLHATTRDNENFNKIWDEAGNLNLKKLTKETQTPFLEFENGKIGGHEGRHRMAALAKQGYTEVPIVVKPYWSSGRNFSPVDQMTFAPQFEGRNPVTINNAIPLNKNYADQIGNLMSLYDEHFKSGGFARNNYATDGSVLDNNTIEMPHSLKELQNWHKTHPAPKPMVRASDDPTSILYNERKLDMPNSLEELQNWARKHHASGGNVHDEIAKALHLARKHFDDGGESGESRDSEWTHDYNSSLGVSDNADNSGNKSDNPRADSLAQSQQASDDAQRAADIRANNQDVGRFSFGNDVNLGGVNLTGHDMPRGLIDYTEQRLNTPYEGTLLSAAMEPGTAFGMSYPELLDKHLTKEGAQAFLANLGYESTQGGKVFNPQAVSKSGYGLAQWTDPKRQQEFFSAMLQPGQAMPQTAQEKRDLLASTTPQQQLGYALKEALSGKYGPSAQAMTTPGNLADKVATIARNYEGAGIPAIGNRVALANQIAANRGYGSFAQNAFSDTPSNVYAANVPMPIARPEDLNPAQAAAVAQNIPTPTARPFDLGQAVAPTPSADPYGTEKIAEMARAILSAQRPNAPTPSVSATKKILPFIGSTEDPEVIANQQAMLLAMRGYASGGKVDDQIANALRIAQNMGRGNDTILAHINPSEAAMLRRMGGSGKRNPYTGLYEFDDGDHEDHESETRQADNDREAQDAREQEQRDQSQRDVEQAQADQDRAEQDAKEQEQRDQAQRDAEQENLPDENNASEASEKLGKTGFSTPENDTITDTNTVDPDAKYRDMMNQPGWGSEDPAAIAAFNAHNYIMGYGKTGPQTYLGELAVGQRTPPAMVPTGQLDKQNNPIMTPSLGGIITSFGENLFAPSFVGVNTPQYQDLLEQKGSDVVGPNATTPIGGRGGDSNVNVVPLPSPQNSPAAPVVPATPIVPFVPYVPPPPFKPAPLNTNTPYKDYGAFLSSNASAYTNPALNRFLSQPTPSPFYQPSPITYNGGVSSLNTASPYQNPFLPRQAARGGSIQGNNALANAIRMAMGYKP